MLTHGQNAHSAIGGHKRNMRATCISVFNLLISENVKNSVASLERTDRLIGVGRSLYSTQSLGVIMLQPLFPLLAAGSFCWFVASSLWIYPHSLSYFNESIGGPLNGSAHLLGSNVDWGQDLRYLNIWLGKLQSTKRVYFASLLFLRPHDLKINAVEVQHLSFEEAPKSIGPGLFLIGASVFGDFSWTKKTIESGMLKMRSTPVAGYSIRLFEISESVPASIKKRGLSAGKND